MATASGGAATVDDKTITNGPNGLEIAENFSSPVYGFMNNSAGMLERLDLEQSLNAWNHDDGFIDIFWNQDKISNASNVNIVEGQNNSGDGYIDMTNVSTTNPGDFGTNVNSPARGYKISMNEDAHYIEVQPVSGASIPDIYLLDSNNNVLDSKSGSFTESDTVKLEASLTSGNTYYVVSWNGGNDYTTGYSSSASYPYTSNIIDLVNGAYGGDLDTVSSMGNRFSFQKVEAGNYNESGSVTHTTKDLGFNPSKIQADPEYQSNGQTLELVIHDTSGHTVVIPESKFGTEVDTSDLADQTIQPEWQFSGDGTATPVVHKTSLTGVQ